MQKGIGIGIPDSGIIGAGALVSLPVPTMHWRPEELTGANDDPITTWTAAQGPNGTASGVSSLLTKTNVLNGYSVAEFGDRTRLDVDGGRYAHSDSTELAAVFRHQTPTNTGWLVWEWTGSGITGIRSNGTILKLVMNSADVYDIGAVGSWLMYYRRKVKNGANWHWMQYVNDTLLAESPTATFNEDAVIFGHATVATQDAQTMQLAEVQYYQKTHADYHTLAFNAAVAKYGF